MSKRVFVSPELLSLCQALGQSVRPSRFSIFILALGAAAFFLADQTPEALMVLGQRGNPWAVLAFVGAVVQWGHTSWYLARVLSRFEYPDRARLTASAHEVETFVFRWLPRALGVAPMAVVSLALWRCSGGENGVLPILGLVIAAGFLWGAFMVLRRRVLDRLRQMGERRGWEGSVASLWAELGTFTVADKHRLGELPFATKVVLCGHFAIFFALVVVFARWPVDASQDLGAQTVLVLALSGWIVTGSLVTYFASWTRMPLFVFIAVYAVLISPANDNHVATARGPGAIPAASRPPVAEDFKAWHDAHGGPDAPFIVVATEGGGIRAAYWTAAMLAALQDTDHDFASRIYAISSVSGGSVGSAVFAALLSQPPANYRNAAGKVLSHDALAPPLARMLYPDLLQRFWPCPLSWTDRGVALEDALVRALQDEHQGWELFGQDIDAEPGRLPRLFFNTTCVETGKRVVLAYPRMVPPCIDTTDGSELARFTVGEAALASARFPYVSPADTLPPAPEDEKKDGEKGKQKEKKVVCGHLVDGGYFENSGSQTAMEILGATGALDHARLILLRFEDGKPLKADRWATELTAPPDALLAARDAREALAIENLKAMFGTEKQQDERIADLVLKPVGTDTLPLGWLLSARARTDINFRVDEALALPDAEHPKPGPARKVLGWLHGGASAAPPAPVSSSGVLLANDGTDARRPVLSPDDATFTDERHGWGWSDRCLREGRARRYGWAMAACDRGLALPDLDPAAKPALLYNEGLVAEESGDVPGARNLYARALALRGPEDPLRQTVMLALSRVGGNPCAAGEQAGVCLGMTGSLCCYKKCAKDTDCPAGHACGESMCIPAPP